MSTSDPAALVAWADEREVEVADLLAGLVVARTEHLGVAGVEHLALVADSEPVAPADLPIAGADVTPDLLGEVLGVAGAASRRHEGAVFTPRPVAEGLVRVALDAFQAVPRHVLDPSVGGGVFLLAAVRSLVQQGVAAQVAFDCVEGIDADRRSVEVTEAALALWLAETEGGPLRAVPAVQQGDFLLRDGDRPGVPKDLVVGNPPFLSQLRRATTRSPERLAALRERYGRAVGPYTDDAALFLLAGLEVLGEGGVLALVQPRSFLGADGAGEVRRQVLGRTALLGLWEPVARVFPVSVDVCAPVLVQGAEQPPEVRVWHEVDLGESAGTQPSTSLLGEDPADGLGSSWAHAPPRVVLPPLGGRLGDVATVTAGFRDQFYGMAEHLHEASGAGDDRPRLVTSGLIDPGVHRWGERPARIARRTWTAPVLDADALDPDARVGRWVAARRVPKVVVASQTKVLEAALDLEGRVLPSPPTVSVEAPADQLPRMLAVLLAPATTAWLHRRAAGTGLAPDGLRVSRAHLAEVPLPADQVAWDEATELLLEIVTGPDARPLGDDAATRAFGEAMATAAGLPPDTADDVVTWWLARLPTAALA